MPSTLPVVLILGSGPNIGHHVARTFAAKGYKVALASRKMKEEESTTEQLNVSSDLSDPGSVGSVFSKVSATLGHPSVVVYNGETYQDFAVDLTHQITAGAVTFNDPKNPFSVPLEDFKRTLSVNTLSPFVAAQQAVLGFERLPDSAAKTFIFTGNITNTITIANLVDQGAGKSATAHIIQAASTAYSDRGFKYEIPHLEVL